MAYEVLSHFEANIATDGRNRVHLKNTGKLRVDHSALAKFMQDALNNASVVRLCARFMLRPQPNSDSRTRGHFKTSSNASDAVNSPHAARVIVGKSWF